MQIDHEHVGFTSEAAAQAFIDTLGGGDRYELEDSGDLWRVWDTLNQEYAMPAAAE